MGLKYSKTLSGGIIFSVLVVKPENKRKGIKTMGAISTATYKLGIIVPRKIPIIIPTKHSKTQMTQNPKN